MNRQFRSTSNEAHESIKDLKEGFYKKILKALSEMKDGGTSESIAHKAGIEYAQCHKRLAELVVSGKVYNTGETAPNSSGRKAMIRKVVEIKKQKPKQLVQSELF